MTTRELVDTFLSDYKTELPGLPQSTAYWSYKLNSLIKANQTILTRSYKQRIWVCYRFAGQFYQRELEHLVFRYDSLLGRSTKIIWLIRLVNTLLQSSSEWGDHNRELLEYWQDFMKMLIATDSWRGGSRSAIYPYDHSHNKFAAMKAATWGRIYCDNYTN